MKRTQSNRFWQTREFCAQRWTRQNISKGELGTKPRRPNYWNHMHSVSIFHSFMGHMQQLCAMLAIVCSLSHWQDNTVLDLFCLVWSRLGWWSGGAFWNVPKEKQRGKLHYSWGGYLTVFFMTRPMATLQLRPQPKWMWVVGFVIDMSEKQRAGFAV